MVSVKVEVPPTAIVAPLKAFAMVGTWTKVTVSVTVFDENEFVENEHVLPDGVHVTLPELLQLLNDHPEAGVAVSVTVPLKLLYV